jgi:outer membrane protein assembly factor BamB
MLAVCRSTSPLRRRQRRSQLTVPTGFTLAYKSSETVSIQFAPQAQGNFRGSLAISGNGKTVSVALKGKGRGPFPTINSITVEPQPVLTTGTLSASASDPSGSVLSYTWTVGGVSVASGANANWTSPGVPGNYLIGLRVTNGQGAIATASVPVTVSSQSPWPRFRRSIQATGLSTVDTSADIGSQKWKFFTLKPNFMKSSPAVGADGTIYVGSEDAYALNSDGSLKWKFTTSAPIVDSSPAVGADGTIYIGADHNVYALNPDGTQKWKLPPATSCSPRRQLGRTGQSISARVMIT